MDEDDDVCSNVEENGDVCSNVDEAGGVCFNVDEDGGVCSDVGEDGDVCFKVDEDDDACSNSGVFVENDGLIIGSVPFSIASAVLFFAFVSFIMSVMVVVVVGVVAVVFDISVAACDDASDEYVSSLTICIVGEIIVAVDKDLNDTFSLMELVWFEFIDDVDDGSGNVCCSTVVVEGCGVDCDETVACGFSCMFEASVDTMGGELSFEGLTNSTIPFKSDAKLLL